MVVGSDVLEALRSHPDPAVTAPDLAESLPVGRRAILDHLRSLERSGRVESKRVGARARVWWPAEDEADEEGGVAPASGGSDSTTGAVDGALAELSSERPHDLDGLFEAQPFDESVLDTLADVLYVLNGDGEFVAWNDRLAAVSGYDDEEIATMDPVEFVAPADRERIAEAIASVVNDGAIDTVETALVTRDGEHVPYQFNGAPLRDDEGDVWGLVGIGRDVAAQKERERTLERQRSELRQVNCHGHGGPWLVSGLAASYPRGLLGRSRVGIPDSGAG